MSENKLTVQDVLKRIEKLNTVRANIEQLSNAVETHSRDLSAQGVVTGVDSDEYKVKKEILESTEEDLRKAKEQEKELAFTKVELKPILDEVGKKFEDELRSEQEREFHVEIGSVRAEDDSDDDWKKKQQAGQKAFKNLLEYLYKDVNWTAKTAPGLMVLVRNMEENKYWVRDKEFDNVISLRSSNVLVLWRSILEEMTGKGYYEARAFLECWANCGKGLSDAVREIQKLHEDVRVLGTQLNTIEDEYLRSEGEVPAESEVSTADEVAPEV